MIGSNKDRKLLDININFDNKYPVLKVIELDIQKGLQVTTEYIAYEFVISREGERTFFNPYDTHGREAYQIEIRDVMPTLNRYVEKI